MKLTHFCFHKEGVHKESLEDLVDMLALLRKIFREDEYVVQIYEKKYIKEISKYVIDQMLKNCLGIA